MAVTELLLGILFFILSIVLISWGADSLLDSIEDISEKYSFSPVLLALLILGIDLEEFVASIIAAINGNPEIALGNVVGNSIISISFIFALPGFFFLISLDQVNPKIIILYSTTILIIFLSFVFPVPFWLMGTFSLIIYCSYVFIAIKETVKDKNSEKNIEEENLQNNDTAKQEKSEEVSEEGEEKEKKLSWLIIKTIIGLAALYGGAELLDLGLDGILAFTSISESFIGLLIIAAATNTEEYFILFKSIKRKKAEIGVNTLIGKLIWNASVVFAISTFIIKEIDQVSIMLLSNSALLLFIILPIFVWLTVKKKELNKKTSALLLATFVIFLTLTFLFQFLNI